MCFYSQFMQKMRKKIFGHFAFFLWVLSLKQAFSEKIRISLELKDFLIIPKVLYCSISELGLYEANLAKTSFSPRYGTLKFRYLSHRIPLEKSVLYHRISPAFHFFHFEIMCLKRLLFKLSENNLKVLRKSVLSELS